MTFLQTYSLVMPAFNEERYVGAQLDSILAQSRQPDEIIVVDDCSTDSTPALLDGYAARYPHVRIFHLPENVGVSRALLFGLEQASGTYVSPISANDLVPMGIFEIGMDLLARYPGASLFTADPASLSRDGQIYWRRLGYADGPCFIAPEQVLHLPLAQNPMHSAGLWVRRDLLLALPGWVDIGYACDRWFLHVLALRHGFCYAPVPGYVMREHERPQLLRDRRLIIESKVLDLLDSPDYADVRAALIACGIFAADGWGDTFVHALLLRYDRLRGHVDPPISETIGREVLGLTPPPAPVQTQKTHAVLAFANELLQQPALGRTYAATFGPDDDVTLVVYAPGQDPNTLAEQLAEAVPELATDQGPDVVLLALPEANDAAMAERCRAILTHSTVPVSLAALDRFGVSDLPQLQLALA